MNSAKWKSRTDSSILTVALLHKKAIHTECLANQKARIDRKRIAEENFVKKNAPLDESITDEVARYRKAKADGLFQRLFYPQNGPCPFA